MDNCQCSTLLISWFTCNFIRGISCNYNIQSKVQSTKKYVVPVDAMQTYSGVVVQLHSFLTSVLNGSGQRQDHAALPPLKETPVSTQCECEWAPEGVWMFWIREIKPIAWSL